MTTRLLVTLIIYTFTAVLPISGRSPAVEPVSGISIDQYEKSPTQDPNKAGYDWTKSDASRPEGFQPTALIDNQVNNDISFYLLVTSLTLLPFAAIFIYRRRKRISRPDPAVDLDNIVDLSEHRGEGHDDVSKAS